jgi:hypothetical protein
MRDVLNIRNVDSDTAVRFRTLAAHYGLGHAELLAKLCREEFDRNMDSIMGRFTGGSND